MDTSSAESNDRLRQAIDDEIDSLQESIRALKFRRNTLAPISRLLPEILVAIFSISSHGELRHLDRICVSHVCRRWRGIGGRCLGPNLGRRDS